MRLLLNMPRSISNRKRRRSCETRAGAILAKMNVCYDPLSVVTSDLSAVVAARVSLTSPEVEECQRARLLCDHSITNNAALVLDPAACPHIYSDAKMSFLVLSAEEPSVLLLQCIHAAVRSFRLPVYRPKRGR